MAQDRPSIAILGGTGDLGGGLAKRWANAGYQVIIGSRKQEKAEAALQELEAEICKKSIAAMDNLAAAEAADLVVLTVPFSHQVPTLEAVKPALTGKILIDVTVPLMPPKVGSVQLPDGGSAGQIAQDLLGTDVKVVSAFQNVAAHHLQSDHEIDCDVLVSGDDPEARETVIGLAGDAGMQAFHAGPNANAAAAEALTSVLIQINRRHKCHAGIRISGLTDAG